MERTEQERQRTIQTEIRRQMECEKAEIGRKNASKQAEFSYRTSQLEFQAMSAVLNRKFCYYQKTLPGPNGPVTHSIMAGDGFEVYHIQVILVFHDKHFQWDLTDLEVTCYGPAIAK